MMRAYGDISAPARWKRELRERLKHGQAAAREKDITSYVISALEHVRVLLAKVLLNHQPEAAAMFGRGFLGFHNPTDS